MSDATTAPTTAPLSFGAIAAAHARHRTSTVAAWLWCVAGLVFLMVFLGGATRLTESGLSITEWKPVSGVVPPLGRTEWAEAFRRYQQIPQYASMFPDMTLGHFQAIFLMEWFHRLVGRLLGVALLGPMIWFWVRGRLTPRLKGQLLGIFALGGLQGAVGWWMVASGLKDRIEVAQERLAVHLLLASVTLAALVWVATAQTARTAVERVPAGLRHLASAFVALVFLQIGLGALVAGLRAGQAYNTWPLMDGRFLLPGDILGALTPLWRNMLDNAAMVQTEHRLVAYGLLAVALGQALATARMAPGTAAMRRALALAGLVTAQATIGIMTLLLVVPVWAGLLHQLFAMVVLAMSVVHRQRLEASRPFRGRVPPGCQAASA